MSVGRSSLAEQSVATTPKKSTFKDRVFYGIVGFLCLSTIGSIARIANPEWAAQMDAEAAHRETARAEVTAQTTVANNQKKEQVRIALLAAKKFLVSNAPRYMLSYAAANECVEITREAWAKANDAGEDDLAMGFINVQMKCSEWASLSWNAGRP